MAIYSAEALIARAAKLKSDFESGIITLSV